MSTEVEYFEGFKTTKKGRALIAKLLAEETLQLSKVTAGSGRCPNTDEADLLEDLISHEMEGTSTTPTYDIDTVSMELEFRSDMNGGVEKGFFLYELGVFAIDPDEGEILIYYGSLGDMPNYISAMATGRESTFRYPVSITIGEDKGGVVTGYPANAFVTHQEHETHNNDPEAHPGLLEQLGTLGNTTTVSASMPEDMKPGDTWWKIPDTGMDDDYTMDPEEEVQPESTPDPEPDPGPEPEPEPEPELEEDDAETQEPNGEEVMSHELLTVDEEMPLNLKVDGVSEGISNITEENPSKYTIN